ncbi:MAG: transglutaminase-like domain-containing protein [Emergencia sp.]
MNYDDLKYLAVPLPEDIEKEKWAGNYDTVREMIRRRLDTDVLPVSLRRRLELEEKNLQHLEKCYIYTEEEALAVIRERIPSFTADELEQLRLDGRADWIRISGKVRYLRSFANTLFLVYPEMKIREKAEMGLSGACLEETAGVSGAADAVDLLLEEDLQDGQETSAHIHIRHRLSLAPEEVEEGKRLLVHLPLPVERDQIRNLKIISVSPEPVSMPELSDGQPAAAFSVKAEKGQEFSVEYAFDHITYYHDLTKAASGSGDLRDSRDAALPDEVKPFLEEQLPHIRFTPYMRELAAEIAGDGDMLQTARRIYDYVTTKITYRFVRDYACIDNLAEYSALNGKGDCGIQALLFITLCRLCGIPAQWQSGIDAKPGEIGQHDWASFWIPSKGWLYTDLSYGGSAWRRGDLRRWNYFFGNADPYRIPINSRFQEDLRPAKAFWREDPYDNQCGEVEYEDRGLYGSAWSCAYDEIDIHRIR